MDKRFGAVALGQAMRQQRMQLGLTQEQVAERGGPSMAALTRLEAGRSPRPHSTTLAAVDRSLDWEPGTAAEILSGSSLEESEASRDLTVTESQLSEFITSNSMLHQHLSANNDSVGITYLTPLTDVTNALLGQWIDKKIASGDSVALLFLKNMLAAQPMTSEDSPDYDQQLYRRWMLGVIGDEQIPKDKLAAFRQRNEGLEELR